MVLESLINPYKAEQNPSRLIFYGFLYASVAMFLALWTFSDQASIVFVFLTVMAAIPLMFNIISEEEKKDVGDFREMSLLKEHWKALLAFMALFLGITLAVVAWYVLLPLAAFIATSILLYILFEEPLKKIEMKIHLLKGKHIITFALAIILGLLVAFVVANSYPQGSHTELFQTQISTIHQINARVTGMASISGLDAFSMIFFNNVKVLIFCILFSFLYGAGAIFVLTWNASVIGTAIGNYISSNLAHIAEAIGLNTVAQYFNVVSIGLFKYVIHGVPEILAYFVAALAGGIISVGVIKHDLKGRKFEHIILDAADLLLLSLGILLVAAVFEVWITPLIFG